MNKITPCLFLLSSCLFVSTASAQRVDNKVLHTVANEYRQSVVNFEHVVKGIRGFTRADQLIVDKFEEATKRVVIAAKNPRQASRLRTEYGKTVPLQQQVERTVFGKYTPHHELIEAWRAVLFFQYHFEQEYAFHTVYPQHGNRVQRRVISTRATTAVR